MTHGSKNMSPHAEARLAMTIWSQEYAYEQKGGSMDFWDNRSSGQKKQCADLLDAILNSPRADGTPSPASRQPATEYRNDEAGYVEFIETDAPYIVRDLPSPCAILVDMETRRIVGYRVYDPGTQPQTSSPVSLSGWIKVPAEPNLDLLKSINFDNQVLAYENGRYYNAWFEFEESEGGWFWRDDADSEPNPSHYMPLPAEPRALAATSEGSE